MVSSFSVRPEQVDVLSADIANDAKGIAQELDNLDTQVKSLIEQWDGAAREAYHQAQRDWNGKLQEMNQILGRSLRRPRRSPSSMSSPTPVPRDASKTSEFGEVGTSPHRVGHPDLTASYAIDDMMGRRGTDG